MGEQAAWGRHAAHGVRCRDAAPAAVRDAVPLGQHADPVGPLRRRWRLGRRLHLRLHAVAASTASAGRSPSCPTTATWSGWATGAPATPTSRSCCPPRSRRAGCARRWPPTATGWGKSSATPTRSSPRSGPPGSPRRAAWSSPPTRSTRGRSPTASQRLTGDAPLVVTSDDPGRLGPDRRVLGEPGALAGVGPDGLRGRRHPAPARGRLRHAGPHRAVLPPGRGALHPPHARSRASR